MHAAGRMASQAKRPFSGSRAIRMHAWRPCSTASTSSLRCCLCSSNWNAAHSTTWLPLATPPSPLPALHPPHCSASWHCPCSRRTSQTYRRAAWARQRQRWFQTCSNRPVLPHWACLGCPHPAWGCRQALRLVQPAKGAGRMGCPASSACTPLPSHTHSHLGTA